jgi:hypothetical protein
MEYNSLFCLLVHNYGEYYTHIHPFGTDHHSACQMLYARKSMLLPLTFLVLSRKGSIACVQNVSNVVLGAIGYVGGACKVESGQQATKVNKIQCVCDLNIMK